MKELIKKITPLFLLNWYHFVLALLGAVLYGFPSKKIKVIGVTGTNGKTTVTEMISKILEEAGYRVALSNSIRFKIDKWEEKNMLKMTMPGRLKLQRFLKQAVNSGCHYAVLEVTSEGLKQNRHRFIDFKVAVFTNLEPEHIEAHGGFEKYREAKGRLFQTTKGIHIINLDDKNADYFLEFPAEEKWGYGIEDVKPGIREEKIKLVQVKIRKKPPLPSFTIGNLLFQLRLIGDFNIYNALAAICLGLSQGIDLEICQKAIESFEGVPGRMEEVISQPFKVIVDYAVTPKSLEQAYQTVKNLFLPKRLICVFGACGGGRDKWKRPVLGEIASRYCQEIILTNEDPYDEDPLEIIEQIASGIKNDKLKIEKIVERREAIKKALEKAGTGDLVIITGKGSEPWLCVAKGKKIPWDDREVVKEEFEKLYHF